MERIETKRLILREFRESDYDDLYEFLSKLREDEFEGCPGITYENGRQELRQRIESKEFYAMELKETGKVIGNIYCGSREFEAIEIGYIVNKDYQKNGYALEALNAVAAAGFCRGVHRIYAQCDPHNEPSRRLLEAAGFRKEALLRENVFFFRDENGDPR